MPYGLIPLVASIALTGVYLVATEAGYGWKALVLALLVASFLWRYGFYLQVAISIGLSLYFTWLRSR